MISINIMMLHGLASSPDPGGGGGGGEGALGMRLDMAITSIL